MELVALHDRPPAQPPLQLDCLPLDEDRALYVVRDDLLPAGTKQRAVIPLLQELSRKGVSRLTYASPFAGFAQVALAYGCRALGLRCTIYSERDPSQRGMEAHPFALLAQGWGAQVVLVKNLEEGERRATDLAITGSAYKIPLGFHCREFQSHFQQVVASSLESIRAKLDFLPKRIWLPVGSGTLAHAFYQAAPRATQFCCVDVHVLRESDARIRSLRELPRVQYFSAQERFHEQAIQLPPISSNLHYDAKLWSFISRNAQNGDLWWNVAR
jgi:hypothetical protein